MLEFVALVATRLISFLFNTYWARNEKINSGNHLLQFCSTVNTMSNWRVASTIFLNSFK